VFFSPDRGKPPTRRFDAPRGNRSLTVAALRAAGDFGVLYVDLVDLQIRNAAVLTASRPLRLVQAYGAGLSRIGCTATLSTTRYANAGTWLLALWFHKDQLDGLIYHSRHNPEHLCAAVFNRSGLALTVVRSEPLLADAAKVARVLEAHGKSVALP
jgi:RES domain-containing protein